MALPFILPAVASFLGSKRVSGALSGFAGGGGAGDLLGAITGGAKKRRRRAKKRLTSTEMGELMFIKNTLGKTAAANALPFYLRKGG